MNEAVETKSDIAFAKKIVYGAVGFAVIASLYASCVDTSAFQNKAAASGEEKHAAPAADKAAAAKPGDKPTPATTKTYYQGFAPPKP